MLGQKDKKIITTNYMIKPEYIMAMFWYCINLGGKLKDCSEKSNFL